MIRAELKILQLELWLKPARLGLITNRYVLNEKFEKTKSTFSLLLGKLPCHFESAAFRRDQQFSICKWIYNGKNVTLNLWICHMLVGRWKAWRPYRVFKLNMTYFKGQYSQLKLTSKLWNHYKRDILRIEETKICILSIQLTPAAKVRSHQSCVSN